MSATPRRVAFQDSRDRLDRAQAHRTTFNDAWKALLKSRPHKTIVRVEVDGTGTIWVEPPPLPIGLSLELGEMLYQLRAALDACVYRAAVLDSGIDPPPNENALEFPICLTQTSWRDSARKVAPLSDEHRQIIEQIQPYNAAKYPGMTRVIRSLGILNDWARKDRHRRLHIVRAWLGPVQPRLQIGEPARLASLVARAPGLLEGDTEVARFVLEGWIPGTKIKVSPYIPFEVAVDESPPPEGPTDTLDRRVGEMFYAVRFMVEAFEKTFEPPYPIKVRGRP